MWESERIGQRLDPHFHVLLPLSLSCCQFNSPPLVYGLSEGKICGPFFGGPSCMSRLVCLCLSVLEIYEAVGAKKWWRASTAAAFVADLC